MTKIIQNVWIKSDYFLWWIPNIDVGSFIVLFTPISAGDELDVVNMIYWPAGGEHFTMAPFFFILCVGFL